MYREFEKRTFDIVATSLGGILVLPIILFIMVCIKLGSRGPMFYCQKRVGRNFKEFNIYKFRSMVIDAEKNGPMVTSCDDPRITKVGRFLRKTKLDELPQFINILKGDMSLVGPRPEVMKFVEVKKKEYEEILTVRPGLTDNAGLAFLDEETIMQQYPDKEKAYVDIILPEKIKLYQLYINNISFFGDIKLLLKTLKAI